MEASSRTWESWTSTKVRIALRVASNWHRLVTKSTKRAWSTRIEIRNQNIIRMFVTYRKVCGQTPQPTLRELRRHLELQWRNCKDDGLSGNFDICSSSWKQE